VAFIDSGRNVLVAGSTNVSEPIREIANQCGIDFDGEGTAVIDHFNSDASDPTGQHTLIASSHWTKTPVILGKGPSAPVLFSGVGHATSEGTRLLTNVLTASDSAFSARPGAKIEECPQSAGRDTLLVTALQARNNARAVFAGSLDMFSDKFFNAAVKTDDTEAKKSGNEEFCIELSKWTFAERGLLRSRDLSYHIKGSNVKNPQQVRIKDNLEFSIVLEEFSLAADAWVPFKADNVQLEFTMIDPYQRINLKHDGKGVFSTSFMTPDVYGVYKFVINYWRVGYGNLEVSHQVSVHPFRHNEFERFIDVAYPYYLSALTTFFAFFIFGIVFLYTKDDAHVSASASSSSAEKKDN